MLRHRSCSYTCPAPKLETVPPQCPSMTSKCHNMLTAAAYLLSYRKWRQQPTLKAVTGNQKGFFCGVTTISTVTDSKDRKLDVMKENIQIFPISLGCVPELTHHLQQKCTVLLKVRSSRRVAASFPHWVYLKSTKSGTVSRQAQQNLIHKGSPRVILLQF